MDGGEIPGRGFRDVYVRFSERSCTDEENKMQSIAPTRRRLGLSTPRGGDAGVTKRRLVYHSSSSSRVVIRGTAQNRGRCNTHLQFSSVLGALTL